MSIYSLTVNVERTYSRKLRSNGFKLCFAKCINGSYSVVWDAVDFSFRDNLISWSETYTLFELTDDNYGLVKNGRIQVSPKTMQLKPGQHVTLNTAGILESTEDPTDVAGSNTNPGVMHITSQKAPIRVGLSCQLAHRARSLKPVLLGVDLKRKAPLAIAIAPEPRVLVWFDSHARPGDAVPPAVLAAAREVDFAALGTHEHQINFVPPPVPRIASGVWTEGALLQA